MIFFAIPSATIRSASGMNGLLLQPGRDEEGLCAPGSHRVTGWAAISFSSRAVLFFPRLTNQHPLSFGPRIGSRRFIEAH